MITQGDEYPIHQTPEPVQQVFTSDRNFYDRFFFNGCFREGEPYFAVAMGIYPNLGIIDSAFSVTVGGVQHSVRASRVLGAERMDTRVGPISIEVVRPMRSMRVRVDHEAVKADLMFEARAAALEEPRFTRRAGPRIVMDMTRFTQHGGYSGSLTIAGKTYNATPSRVWGARDRSWGVRGIGPQDPAGVPSPAMGQYYWLWSPGNFEDVCTLWDVNENADGSRWHEHGAVTHAEPGAPVDLSTGGLTVNINYASGTRHAKSAEIILRTPQAGESRIDLKILYNFYMNGIGYFHPKWGHGMYVGPDVSTYDSLKVADVDQRDFFNQHIEAVCQAKMGSREGMAVLEMLILGPHDRSGFKELLDMHP